MNLKYRKKKIKENFKLLENWENRYEYLIDLGNKLKKKSDKFRSKDKLIYGCQSNLWLEAKYNKKRIFFDADSDALLPRGIAALIIYLYSGLLTTEIINSNYDFISEIGFSNFLSPNRSNGMILLVKKIKLYSINFEYKNSVENNYNKNILQK